MKLVLLRHGESVWNKENRFTGWTDVELSTKGTVEAKEAGVLLRDKGFVFDLVYTSVLKRANQTMDLVLGEMGLSNIEIKYSYKLNERHYGALQGLNKDETKIKFGEEQVNLWRRSADTRPPLLDKNDIRYPGNDRLYRGILKDNLPLGESLIDTMNRVVPYYKEEILPSMKSGKNVLIVAHGNSLRALVKHLDKVSNKDIMKIEIPTGKPLVYEFDEKFKVVNKYYL